MPVNIFVDSPPYGSEIPPAMILSTGSKYWLLLSEIEEKLGPLKSNALCSQTTVTIHVSSEGEHYKTTIDDADDDTAARIKAILTGVPFL